MAINGISPISMGYGLNYGRNFACNNSFMGGFNEANLERLNEIDKRLSMQRLNAQTELQIADAIDASLKEMQSKNKQPSLMLLAEQMMNIQRRYNAQRSLMAANHSMLSLIG